MKSVVLISSCRIRIDDAAGVFKAVGSVYIEPSERVVVEGDWGWFAIGLDESGDSFSGEETSNLEKILKTPFFAQLEYRNSASVNLAIEHMPAAGEILIDNDHGALRPIEEIREMIQRGMEWQTSSG